MNRIEVILSMPVVAPLLDVIKGLAGDLGKAPILPHAAPIPEAEFSEMWAGELLASQKRDVDTLLAAFGEEFFAEGKVYFDRNNAEAIARACSAVRLCLRERHLKILDDESLESGEIEMGRLEDPVRKALMCYLFLATIQELIIQHLDDGVIT